MLDKRVVVTGATGFIGSALARRLIDDGAEVLGVAKSVPTAPIRGVRYVTADLSVGGSGIPLGQCRPQVVYHCAGSANVRRSVEEPIFDFDHNVRACYNVLESIRRESPETRFVFLGSAAVYGSPSALPIKESHPLRPISPYGLHKKMCEDLCDYYRDVNGIHTDVARIFSAYGEGQAKQLLWDFAKKAKSGRVELFGTGRESRDFIHIDDLVSALTLIGERGQGRAYNVATGCETTIGEMASLMAAGLGIPMSAVAFTGDAKPGDPKNWKADISELTGIGFKQAVPLEDGVGRFCRWAVKLV